MSTEDKVFAAFKEDPCLESTAQDLAEEMDLSPNTVGQHLLNLFELGKLARRRKSKNGALIYRLAPGYGGLALEQGQYWTVRKVESPEERDYRRVFAMFERDPSLVATPHHVANMLALNLGTAAAHMISLWEEGKIIHRLRPGNEGYEYRLAYAYGGQILLGADTDHGWMSYEVEDRPAVPAEVLAGREQRFAAQAGVVRKTYRALCVGGPLNGKWHEGNDRVFRTMEPPGPVNLMAYATEYPMVPEIKFHTYEIVRLHMFGYDLWVAFDMDDTVVCLNRDTAALRAILQRDVAQAMGL